jgi:hypothetical protein
MDTGSSLFMTMNDIQRAYLAIFAAREAGARASSDQMMAIAMCVRNRVRQGWHDGDWMKVIEHAGLTRAHPPGPAVELDANDRNFQNLARDIEEVYFSRRDWTKQPSGEQMPSLDEAIGNACFWAFINRPYTGWFTDHILHDATNHPQKASMGLMMFYE